MGLVLRAYSHQAKAEPEAKNDQRINDKRQRKQNV